MVIFAVAAVAFCDVILLNGPFSHACENPVVGTKSKLVTERKEIPPPPPNPPSPSPTLTTTDR